MATETQTDGNFSEVASAIVLPVAGVTNWHTFGGTAAAGRANLADAAAPLVDIGVPAIAGSYASLDSNGNAYQTGRAETADMTFFAVAREPTALATTARLVSNAPGTGAGLSFYFPSANQIAVGALFTEDVSGTPTPMLRSVTLAIPDRTTWRLYAARIRAGVGMDVFNLSAETQATLANTNPRSLVAATLRAGMRQTATAGGELDIAHLSFAPFAMSNEQILAHAAFIRSEMLFQTTPIIV